MTETTTTKPTNKYNMEDETRTTTFRGDWEGDVNIDVTKPSTDTATVMVKSATNKAITLTISISVV